MNDIQLVDKKIEEEEVTTIFIHCDLCEVISQHQLLKWKRVKKTSFNLKQNMTSRYEKTR